MLHRQVPVGRATLGRIMNVIGEPIDEKGHISKLIETKKVTINIRNGNVSFLAFSDLHWVLLVSETDHFLPIHREAPAFVEQATEQQILVTGIKVCVSQIIRR